MSSARQQVANWFHTETSNPVSKSKPTGLDFIRWRKARHEESFHDILLPTSKWGKQIPYRVSTPKSFQLPRTVKGRKALTISCGTRNFVLLEITLPSWFPRVPSYFLPQTDRAYIYLYISRIRGKWRRCEF